MAKFTPVLVPEEELEEEDIPSISMSGKGTATQGRPSDPGKQFLAGITDIFTGIPMLAGLAGSGIQAGWNTMTGDKGFGKNFAEAAASGWDKNLLDAGMGGMDYVNESLGIARPVSTEDQAARLLGSFVAPPGMQFIGGASRAAKLGRGAFNVLTPAVKMPYGIKKGFTTAKGLKSYGTRAGIQAGLGTGIEQGIRAATDDPHAPLMFSKKALTGEDPAKEKDKPFDPLPGHTYHQLSSSTSPAMLSTPVPVPDDELDDIPSVSMSGNINNTNPAVEKFRKLDRDVQAEQDKWDTAQYIGLALAAAGTLYGGRKAWKTQIEKHGNLRNVTDNTILATGVDKARALSIALRNIGRTEKEISDVQHNAHTNSFDIVEEFKETGKLGQDYKPRNGKPVIALRTLYNDRRALGKEDAQLFDDAMFAHAELAARQASGGKLWKSAKPEEKLNETIRLAQQNTKVRKLMNDTSNTFDNLLDYQVHRGVFTPKEAKKFRDTATVNGRLSHMPLYTRNKESFLKRLGRNYMFGTPKVREAGEVPTEFSSKGLVNEGNVGPQSQYLNPIEALERYSAVTIKHANDESFKGGVLSALARVKHKMDANGNYTQTDFLTGRPVRAGGKKWHQKIKEDESMGEVTYVGRGSNLDDPSRINVTIDPKSGSKFKDGDLQALKNGKNGDELVTVHEAGEIRVYHVPDKGVRAALNLDPKLGRTLNTLSHWKNLMTKGTTGNWSLFAPISHVYSAQQVAINTAARDGIAAGFKSIGQGLSGTGRLLIINGSRDIANFLSKRISSHIAAGRVPPQMQVKLRQRLEKAVLNSTIHRARTETGRTVTGIGSIGHNAVDEIFDTMGKNFENYGMTRDVITGLKSLWNSWNNAWHEGPAYGAMLKHIGELRNSGKKIGTQDIRNAVDISKDLAGDMSRLGGSEAAKLIHSSVPFSAAMIQSWATIGGAIKHNPAKFMMGASALIGVPTVTEVLANHVMSEAHPPWEDPNNPNKTWTYNDYYWNAFTSQQRADNFIYFVPGKPPWEAIIVPVSPEWGLFRGIVMEGMDAIFGFSDVGDIGSVDQNKTNRNQFLTPLIRVFDIPLPPPIAAAFSAVDADVRLGLSVEQKGEGGLTGSVMRKVPIGKGERVTRRGGETRNAEGVLSRQMTGIIQDLFGAAGTAYVNFIEATGSRITRKDTSVIGSFGEGLSSLADSAKSQTRYLQPLVWGKTLHANPNDEIANNLFASRKTLGQLKTDMSNGYIGGGIAYSDGQPIVGNTMIPPDDPINLELAASAKQIDSNIGQLDSQIAKLRKDLTTIPNSTNLGNSTERRDLMDSTALQIKALKAQQLAVIHEFEDELGAYLTKEYGRDVTVDFTNYKPRANLAKGSISSRLQK